MGVGKGEVVEVYMSRCEWFSLRDVRLQPHRLGHPVSVLIRHLYH